MQVCLGSLKRCEHINRGNVIFVLSGSGGGDGQVVVVFSDHGNNVVVALRTLFFYLLLKLSSTHNVNLPCTQFL